MKIARIGALALAIAPHHAAAQELQSVNGRQCAAPGTELHTSLVSRLPGCDLYCAIDPDLVPGYEDYPGLVFACADGAGTIVVQQEQGSGLSAAAALGILAGVGVLVGMGSGGSGGATNHTVKE